MHTDLCADRQLATQLCFLLCANDACGVLSGPMSHHLRALQCMSIVMIPERRALSLGSQPHTAGLLGSAPFSHCSLDGIDLYLQLISPEAAGILLTAAVRLPNGMRNVSLAQPEPDPVPMDIPGPERPPTPPTPPTPHFPEAQLSHSRSASSGSVNSGAGETSGKLRR